MKKWWRRHKKETTKLSAKMFEQLNKSMIEAEANQCWHPHLRTYKNQLTGLAVCLTCGRKIVIPTTNLEELRLISAFIKAATKEIDKKEEL